MKIQKVIEIKNVGKFRNYSAAGDLTFSDFCVIYGENGKGKTTFSTILRSLKTGDTSLLHEKKTTTSSDPISIKLLLENNQVAEFNESLNNWNVLNQDLEIFDSIHVNNNVYSGDHVDHLHKRNLYYLVIGDVGVQLAKEIEDLDAKIKTESEELKSLECKIKAQMRSTSNFKSYLDLVLIEGVDEKIKEIDKTLGELQESETILSKDYPKPIEIPNLNFSELQFLLNLTLDNISEEARKQVISHCNLLDVGGENWLKQGIEYIPESNSPSCPFCQQEISNLQILEQYRAYFSQEYKTLLTQIDQFFSTFSQDFPENKISEIQRKFSENVTLIDFWSRYVSFELNSPAVEQVFDLRREIFNEVKAMLSLKKEKPLDQIDVNSNFAQLVKKYEDIKAVFCAHNEQLNGIRQLIENKKGETSETDIEGIKSCKVRLVENRDRFSQDVIHLSDSFKNKRKEIENLKRSKQEKTDKLKYYSQNVLEKYRTTINEYLCIFGADFEIIEAKTSMVGGKPSASYSLSINGSAISLGTIDTSGEPCFRTVLSDGDKSSLAFALFLSQLRADANLSQKTIIIDDPITSLDSHRKLATYKEIIRISKGSKQCMVLSHDQHFLHYFWKELTAVKPIQIVRDGNQSKFCEWDIQSDTQPEYLKDFYRLETFLEHNDRDLLGVVRCIRPVLEGNLRVRFPKEFGPEQWLGDFIRKIREAKPNSRLSKVKDSLDELDAINGYSKRYHHQQNPAADQERINETELFAYVKRTIKLLEKM